VSFIFHFVSYLRAGWADKIDATWLGSEKKRIHKWVHGPKSLGNPAPVYSSGF